MVGMNEYVFVSKKIIESVGFSGDFAESRRAVPRQNYVFAKTSKIHIF